MASRAMAEGPVRKGGKKVLDHLRVHEAENGGHMVEHHYEQGAEMGGYHEPDIHVFGEHEGNEALLHIAKHAKIKHTLAGKEGESKSAESAEPSKAYKGEQGESEQD